MENYFGKSFFCNNNQTIPDEMTNANTMGGHL